MANKLIPWQRYLSDVAHKYVGYPDEEGGEDTMIVTTDQDGVFSKTFKEIEEAAITQSVIVTQNAGSAILQYPLLQITNLDEQYVLYLLAIDYNSSSGEYELIIKDVNVTNEDDYPELTGK